MKRRLYNAQPAAWARRDDINYPGVPEDLVKKATLKKDVEYEVFVNGYGRRMSRFAFVGVLGAGSVVGGLFHAVATDGIAPYVLIVVGLACIAAGVVGLAATNAAHDQWVEHGYGVTLTRMAGEPSPVERAERPFVPSANGAGRTIHTGRLRLAPTVWQSLFNEALGNGGVFTRDGVQRAGVERRWYHTDPNADDGYRAFLAELRQMQLVDARNRLTDRALAWYAEQFPALPLDALPGRSDAGRSVYTRPDGDIGSGAGGVE